MEHNPEAEINALREQVKLLRGQIAAIHCWASRDIDGEVRCKAALWSIAGECEDAMPELKTIGKGKQGMLQILKRRLKQCEGEMKFSQQSNNEKNYFYAKGWVAALFWAVTVLGRGKIQPK